MRAWTGVLAKSHITADSDSVCQRLDSLHRISIDSMHYFDNQVDFVRNSQNAMADDLVSASGSDASSLPFGANYSDSQSNTSTVVSGTTSEYVSSETSEDRDFIVDDTESISDSQSISSASEDPDIESLDGEAGYLAKEVNSLGPRCW